MNRLVNYLSNLSISKKFAYIGAVVVIVFLLIISLSMVLIITRVLGDDISEEVKSKAGILIENFELMEQEALAAGEWFSSSERVADAYTSGNREQAIKVGKLAMKSMGLDFFIVTDKTGKVFMRAHRPEKFGDNIINQQNIQRALKGENSVGLEEGADVRLSIRAGAPLKDKSGKIIGAVSTGYILRICGQTEKSSENPYNCFPG